MLKYKSEQRTILTVKRHFKKLPVIKLSYEEHCFPVFADMHSSINPPDSGREAVLVNGASATFHLKLFNHPVLMTWKNTAMSLDLGTLWKTETYHNPCQTQWAWTATLMLHKAVICVFCYWKSSLVMLTTSKWCFAGCPLLYRWICMPRLWLGCHKRHQSENWCSVNMW